MAFVAFGRGGQRGGEKEKLEKIIEEKTKEN